ncbi:MAG: hypothetical protein M3433_01160 [Actinomycetota bacterium]|nr:hypothetical protein [Actinomycetota bacterium]
MTREQAFYQVAVALIPALLFGGAMVERAKPPDNFRPVHGWMASILFAAVLFGISAEIAAIAALLSESPSEFQRDIVVAALC